MIKLLKQQGKPRCEGNMNQHKSRSENNKTVRQVNMRTILDLFLSDSQSTIEGAMARTSLSYPTVLSIFKELLQAGVIDRFGYADSTGGRQASLYSLNPNCGYALGIHLSGSFFSMAITNLRGGIIYEHREEIEFELSYLGKAVCSLIDTALDHTGISRQELLATGICLSAKMRLQLEAAGVNLRRELESAGISPVKEVSEPSIQSHLDKKTFQVLGLHTYLYLTFDRGISISLVNADGPTVELQGDLEHTTVVPDGALCRCGRRGCLKTYYDGAELWQYYSACRRDALDDGADSTPLKMPEGPLRRLRLQSQAGSLPARMAVRHALYYLSFAIANLIVATGVGDLVLSGLFTSRDAEFVHQLTAEIREKLPDMYREQLRLEIGFAQPKNASIGLCQLIGELYAYRIIDGLT